MNIIYKTMLKQILSKNHAHPRDVNIKFYEYGHKYEILNDLQSRYTSVTTFCKSHFPKFDADMIIRSIMRGKNWNETNKYWGQTAEEIKAGWMNNGAAEAGTNLHYDIECFMNSYQLPPHYNHADLLKLYNSSEENKAINTSVEWQYFLDFIKDFPNLKPYRTEWLIYDEDIKIAGSIDMVYQNDDGTISIYDWKRSKEISPSNNYGKFALTKTICHLPDTNFWHYTLQLNMYKKILEEKYGETVRDLFLVRLHPDAEEKTYDLIPLPILKKEMEDLRSEKLKKI